MVNCEAKLTPVCGQAGNPALLFIFLLSTFVILFIVPCVAADSYRLLYFSNTARLFSNPPGISFTSNYFPRQLGIMDTVYDRAHFLPNLLNPINPGSLFCS